VPAFEKRLTLDGRGKGSLKQRNQFDHSMVSFIGKKLAVVELSHKVTHARKKGVV